MAKELIVSSTTLETKLAIMEDELVTEVFVERTQSRGILGNIYKGKVVRVLPGMQAAFVNIGLERNAFLYVTDFFEDYGEFEGLFGGSEESIKDLLDEAQRPRGRGVSRKGRSRRVRGIEEAPPIPAPTEEAAPSDSPAVTPRAPIVQPRAAAILPLELPSGSLEGAGASLDSDQRSPWQGILPDQVEPVSRLPASVEDGNLADQEIGFTSRPDLSRLKVAREKSGRSKELRGPSYGNGELLIGDLLREGQEILVQIAKEPIGKKGARITSHIVLPGRFLVFMPTVNHVGVSRKIESAHERQRLKDLVMELRGDVSRGFIVRTAGENRSEEDFRQDMVYLTRLWESVRSKAEKCSAPKLIHSELDLVQKVVRDFFTDEFQAIRVDDETQYEKLVDFISNFNPDMVSRIKLYNRNIPIFDAFPVNSEIEKSLKPKVWLKNGGYIVINQTEALVAIDVNTGKYVGQTNSLEDTITKTNLDAVKEVVRQVRLRDLGGIIVIDFIDMTEARNRKKVMEALQAELAKDKAPSKILQFNEFGLVAITRKRAKQSLERIISQPCLYCGGTGMTKSVRTICFSIYEEARKLLPTLGEGRELTIRCHPEVAKGLRESEKNVIAEIEELTKKEAVVVSDTLLHLEQFNLIEA